MGFLAALTGFESGNRNIPNTTKGTSSGQAQGNFQITTGTWNDFAPDAGVDLREYPTPLSAPPALQWKVASTIPLHRWAPETLNYLKERGYQLAPDLSLGQNVAANGGSPAKWFSGAPYAGNTPGTPAYLSGSGNAGADPFAEFAAAEKIASGIAPTNAVAKGPAYLSPPPAGNDPFAEFEQPPAQPMQNMTMTGPTGTSSGPENFNVTPAGVASNPGMSANTNLGLTGLRERAAQSASATSPASAPDSAMTAPGGGLDVMNSMPVVGPGILAAGAGVNALLNGDSYAQERALQAQQMQQFEAQHPTAAMGARIGGGALGIVPATVAAPAMFGADVAAPLWANALAGAASGGTLGGLDTAVRENAAGQPISPQAVGTNALIGAAFGGAAPAIGSALGATGRMLGGGTMAPGDAAVARNALDAGYPLTAGQLSNDTGFRFLSSVSDRLPFSGSADNASQIQAAVNRKAADAIGEQAEALTPQVMQNARSRIGNVFDTIAANTTVKADSKFLDSLASVDDEMRNASGMDPNEVEPIAKAIDNIMDKAKSGEITGQQYLDLTRSGTPLSKLANNPNPNISHYAGEVKDALQDALSRSASPEDQATLATAKQQYRNLMTVDGAISKDGRGNVNPVTLATQANTGKFNANDIVYGRAGPLGDIAMLGQAFMKQMPSSGTAERLGWLGAAAKMGTGAAALASGTLGGMTGAAGVPGALMANRLLINPILRSRYLANALVNRSLSGAMDNPGIGRRLLQGGALGVGNALSGQ